ncbi:hypothetical protein PIB30_027916 [Stylosanthes scabra]|uniref:Uncharacterized protein n=1 Tax=Stylosanthes scabra TaxID=79078 RepID=A0ABU6ZB67_9FABA|nr:hypothetical protein [Stylosanthes scabra]
MGSSPMCNGNGDADDPAMDSSTPTHTDGSKSQPPFAVAEKVLAKHKGRFYEAKVRQVELKEDQWHCLVHYLGWKKSWDEWLPTDCLMKDTEDNMQIKLAIDEKFGHDKTKLHRASFNKPKTPNNETRVRKRKSEALTKEESEVPPDKLVNIQIPPTLRKQLVDDCEFITHLGKLVKLPRTPNVNDIMKNYFDYRLKKCGSISNSVEEIMKGLCCYFDKALPVKLLYKNERQQYQEACPDNTTPSTVYGAEHLLRLFVKLPELLSQASIEEESLTELQAQLVDILRFLQRNQSTYFLSTYHVPDDIENSTNKQRD